MADETTMAALEAQVRALDADEQRRLCMAVRPEMVLDAAQEIATALYVGGRDYGSFADSAKCASDGLQGLVTFALEPPESAWLEWLAYAGLEANRA